MRYPLSEGTTRGHSVLLHHPMCMFLSALRGQHGAAVPQGDGGAQHRAPSLKCTEP